MSSEGPTGSAGELAKMNRFDVRRVLGKGGMGVVYEAYDRRRERVVALKTLSHLSPTHLYRFKREFRALAETIHPNLVALYELVATEETWFLTMEFIDGVDFFTHVRNQERSDEHAEDGTADRDAIQPDTATVTLETTPNPDSAERALAPPRPPRCADLQLLRPALRQLVTGVHALHNAGQLHRDIKPSNVMVAKDGRVVLLDFGVITELGARLEPDEIVGTPAYMAPEQVRGTPSFFPASDWYGVGSLLYYTLTGRRPYSGSVAAVLAKKQRMDPPSPRELCPDVPEDLDALCVALLARDPAQRPSGQEILDVLQDTTVRLPVRSRVMPSPPSTVLVGRDPQLRALREAFAETGRGIGVTVYVRGSSGMGKTVLVREFLNELAERDRPVVLLEGRCYQRESVPYKAVDGLVDALCRYLLSLPREQVDGLMPMEVQALAQVFPVLGRVKAIAEAHARADTAEPAPRERRRQAFAALRELLARLAAAGPLVLFIDDLQWGDADSAPLLADLMAPPEAPALLLIAAYRSEDEPSSALLKALFRRETRLGPASNTRVLSAEELPDADAVRLALALLREAGADPGSAEGIARESRGNPYFAQELVRFAATHPAGAARSSGEVPHSLDEVIRSRVAALEPRARHLMEIIAVAGKPTPIPIVERAAEVDHNQRPALDLLRAAHLVHTSSGQAGELVEAYHDRIRQAVTSNLSAPDSRMHHRSLALTLRASGDSDIEAMATHFAMAGDHDVASEYAMQAGDQAAKALAFERAAELYKLALKHPRLDESVELAVRVKCGDALAHAGRGAEAAIMYLKAAEGANAADAQVLQAHAALQYLQSGRLDEGLAALEQALSAVGLKLSRTPTRALLALLPVRARVRLRGLRFRQRDETQFSAEKLARIDVSWTAALGLSMVDHFRGAEFGSRHLLLALNAGEPGRAARALCLEVMFTAAAGWARHRRVERLISTAQPLAEAADRPEVWGWFWAGQGVAEYQFGNFAAARELLERSLGSFSQCAGVTFEPASMQLYQVWALYYLGEFRRLSEVMQAGLKEARRRGDLYAETNLVTGLPSVAWLAADEPESAQAHATEAMARWSRQAFHLQHYWELLGLTQCHLYEGDGDGARARLEQSWHALRRSQLLRIPMVCAEANHLRARAALATAAASGGDKRTLTAAAARAARAIEKDRRDYSVGLAHLAHAGIASIRGNHDGARGHLETAEARFRAAGMALYAAVTQRCMGQLLGGDQGAKLVEEATAWMVRQGIRAPARMTAMLAPGCA